MISILHHLARTTIWCIDLWQNRRVRRQLPPVLGLCLLMGAPAWAQPRVVTLDDAETGSLMFTTTEPGEYVAAPNVRTVVEMEVTGLVARVQVSQLFYNPTDEWLEGVYAFPLPENAAVDTLRMMIGDRYIEGTVKEREEAKEIYEAAKAEGKKTALLEQERPNLFTNSVANIGPDEDVIIQIEYQQVLRYDQGTFELRFPMVVAPRYIPGAPTAVDVPGTGWSWDTDQVPDASRITPPVSAAATDLPVEVNVHLAPGFPLSWVRSVTHDVEVEALDDGSRRVTLADGAVLAERDFVLEWLPEVGSAPAAGLFHEVHGESVFFLMMVMPPSDTAAEAEPMPREVIFVIDTSGSMSGPSIEQAREALAMALTRLGPQDTFDVVEFDNDAHALFGEARPADTANIRQASRFVSSLRADGGTNMLAGLNLALDGGADESRVRQVVFLTDGAVGNEDELFRFINGNLGDSRLFTVGIGSAPNSYFMRKAAEFGHGTFTHIDSVDQVREQMTELFAKLESPVLTDIWVTFPAECNAEIWPDTVPDLYQGEPVVVAGRLDDPACRAEILGRFRGQPWSVDVGLDGGVSGQGIATVWARHKIESLMDLFHEGAREEEVREQVLAVALEHQLVSKYTSLVAVDVTPTRPLDEELDTRAVAVNLPDGWNFDKVFGPVHRDHQRWSADEAAVLDALPTGSADAADDLGREYLDDVPCGAACSGRKLAFGFAALLAGALVWIGRRRMTP